MATGAVRTSSWKEVASFYEGLVREHGWQLEPMLELVRYVQKSSYANSLFPCTSLDLLRIGRVPDFTQNDAELQVRFDGPSQSFTFTYVQRADDAKPWSRTCASSEWRAVLERTLQKRLRWFHEG